MSQEELTNMLTEYIMMSSYGMRPYTDKQSIAYFARMPKNTLSEMLSLCEDLEEYEFCAYIFKAMKSKEVYTISEKSGFSPMAIVD